MDGGSLTLSASVNMAQPNGIYLLCSNQEGIGKSSYSTLCLTSRAAKLVIQGPSESNLTQKSVPTYLQLNACFMRDGDYIRNLEPDHFEMRLTEMCRIVLPNTNISAKLIISSNKINPIQFDGKCDFEINAQDCRLERIFACSNGMVLTNRSDENAVSRFDNCEIFAEDFDANLTPPSSLFLAIWANVANSNGRAQDITNSLILHDCTITNIGLLGTILADNCNFILGANLQKTIGTLKCEAHSRLLNCMFDGRELVEPTLNLERDVVGCNGEDVLIEGCTFQNYRGTSGNLITITVSYTVPAQTDTDPELIDPANAVAIRNCFFDLPTYAGSAFSVWNDPINANVQDRTQNRQFILIEGNYMEMPKASSFVNCMRFTDYVIVRNNNGCVNNRLVLVQQYVPDHTNQGLTGDDRAKNKAHNLIIEGNILRYQRYKKADVPNGMIILTGTYIDNLVLANNYVEGSLWSMWPDDIEGNLTGVVRVINNQSVGNVLFRARSDKNKYMPSDVITFFQGNVSNGKKTDIGPYELKDSTGDCLNFEGRTYIDEEYAKQYILLKKLPGWKWYYCNYLYSQPAN